jgi:transketolase
VDILTAIYFGRFNLAPEQANATERDRIILSKGHAALALFATLASKGYFPPDLLDDFARPDCPLEEHPGPNCAPGVEFATGSLGHGLPLGVGTALAGRLAGRRYRTVVVLGDGELNEGSVWEAIMFAAGQELASITAVVDYNKWQATGRSREVMHLDPLPSKFEAFGWEAREVDGHDLNALESALEPGTGRPVAVVAHTIKGKGVSFMEDDNNWHYRIPTADEVAAAYKELGL